MPAPVSPKEGDLYINTTDRSLWVYESGAWSFKGYLSSTAL